MRQTLYCCSEPMKLKAKWSTTKSGMIDKWFAIFYCLECGREIREEVEL